MKRIDNIEEAIYEGYVWMSNQSQPTLVESELYSCELNPAANPFIVEAQLYCRESDVSVSVRYNDGRYYAYSYENAASAGEGTTATYIAHRMGSHDKLCFRQMWNECADVNCDGMMVLQPTQFVFVGFETKEDGK